MLIASVVDALYRLGAASVIVAEGPGNIRDTDLLLDESGLRAQLEILKRARFVDLNFDSVTRVVPGTGLTQLEEIWLPTTVQSADVVISMPKIKTHHWAGVTLSLKNSFGICRFDLWLAKECSALAGHRQLYRRARSFRPDSLCYRRWNRGHGRQWAVAWPDEASWLPRLRRRSCRR